MTDEDREVTVRPRWVRYGLLGVHARRSAWTIVWLALAIGALLPYPAGTALVLVAGGHLASIGWMDRHRGWADPDDRTQTFVPAWVPWVVVVAILVLTLPVGTCTTQTSECVAAGGGFGLLLSLAAFIALPICAVVAVIYLLRGARRARDRANT